MISLPVMAGETFLSPFKPAEKGTEVSDIPQRYRIWLRSFGNWTQSGSAVETESDISSYGLTLGIDQQWNRHWLAGIAFGENSTSVRFTDPYERERIDSFFSNVFVRRTFHQFFLDAGGNFGINDQSSFSNDTTQWGINGEAGMWWSHGLGKVEPYLRLSHVSLFQDDLDGSNTKGAAIAGIRYSWRKATELTTTVPRLYGGVIQEWGGKSLFHVSPFADTSTVFSLSSAKASESRVFLGGGFTTSMGTSLDISFRYTAEVSRTLSHTALLGFNCNF